MSPSQNVLLKIMLYAFAVAAIGGILYVANIDRDGLLGGVALVVGIFVSLLYLLTLVLRAARGQ